MLLFLLTSHLNSICISDRSNHVLNSLHHSPQENTSIPDVTQWPTHKLHKNILFLCQMENYLFSSGSCCMIVELWKLCNVLMIISIMYFFFLVGNKAFAPCRETDCVKWTLPLAFLSYPSAFFFISLACPGFSFPPHSPLLLPITPSVLQHSLRPCISLSLVSSGTVRKWHQRIKWVFKKKLLESVSTQYTVAVKWVIKHATI